MEILPIPSDAVTCERNNDWSLKYTVDFGTGQGLQAVPESNMLHVRFRSLDGYRGISPIAYAREAIGLALATEKHGARLFRNGARPGGVLEHPAKMSPEAAARFKEQWQAAFSGENAHKTALLEEGMKFNALSMTSEDAQYLETRKFQTADIARIFRVPLHMIQETEKSTSWGSGIEQMTIGFTRFTLLPWLVRWEQAISRCMIGRDERDTVTPRHSVEGMERGDFKSRFAGYQIAIASGILSPNEVRALENMNPREGGDEYMSPLNMRVGADGNAGPNANTNTGTNKNAEEDELEVKTLDIREATPTQHIINVAPPGIEFRAGDISITLPEGMVHVANEFRQDQPDVIVNVPDQEPPTIVLEPKFQAPDIKIDVQPAEVNVHLPARKTETTVERDKSGNIIHATQIEQDL